MTTRPHEEQARRLRALASDPATLYFADDGHDRPDLPRWPLPADVWLWAAGNLWVATVDLFHDDWWEGADPEDIAARPANWRRPIADVPTTGTLRYVTRDGQPITMPAPTRGT